jgi:Protein of unknown function (DUF3800)
VYLCFMDESGDPGTNLGSPTLTYTVACVLVHDSQWVELFEDLLDFRRYLRQSFGLRIREEVKANELVKGSGPWTHLPIGDRGRKRIYRAFLRFQAKAGSVSTFAVIIEKSRCADAEEVRIAAWTLALERVRTFTSVNRDTVMLFPDSGNYYWLRRLSRKMRRHSHVGSIYGGSYSAPLLRVLVDDPVERDSKESFFIQLADLNAYAAYRSEIPDPRFPRTMWTELGGAIVTDVNKYHHGTETPGIVRGPRG